MLIRKPFDIPSSEMTPQTSYKEFFGRRRFLRSAIAGTAAAGAAVIGVDRLVDAISPCTSALADTKLQTVRSPLTTTGEQLTSLQDVSHFNNFYEFGVDKSDPV